MRGLSLPEELSKPHASSPTHHPRSAGQVLMGVQCEGPRALWTVSARKGDASLLQTKSLGRFSVVSEP